MWWSTYSNNDFQNLLLWFSVSICGTNWKLDSHSTLKGGGTAWNPQYIEVRKSLNNSQRIIIEVKNDYYI